MNKFLKIFLIVVASVLILGAILCGGGYFTCKSIGNNVEQQFKENNPQILEQRAKSIADYKLIPGTSLTMALDFMGAKFALFTEQKQQTALILAEIPHWAADINESNFKQKFTTEEIQKQLQKNGRGKAEIRDLKIIKEGKMQTATKEVPYVYLEATIYDTVKDKTLQVEGIIAVMDFSNPKKTVLFVSGSPQGKFSIELAKKFLKTVQVT